MLWHAAPRQSEDKPTGNFLKAISKAWPIHVSKVSGRQFRREAGEPMNIRDAKFVGIARRMPRIQVSDPD